MNTTPTLISPARAVDAKAGAARETGAAETPFSQVLSDEITSQRNAQAGRQSADKPEAKETAARNEPTLETAPTQATDAAAPAEVTATSESLDPALQTALPDPAALLGLAAAPATPQATLATTATTATTATPPAQLQSGDAELSVGTVPTAVGADALTRPLGTTLPQARAPQPRADVQTSGADAPALRAGTSDTGSPAPQSAAAASAIQLAAARQADETGASSEPGFEQILQAVQRSAEPLQQAAARLGAEAAQPRLAPQVGSNAWGQALGDRIVWMANAAQQSATLTLNPPNLGPLQVVLNVSNDQAVANFYAAQPEVRQALESAFPRLKEMLNEAGIQLEQATVSADTSPQQQDTAAGRSSQHAADMRSEAASLAAELPAPLPAQRTGRGLIDTFA